MSYRYQVARLSRLNYPPHYPFYYLHPRFIINVSSMTQLVNDINVPIVYIELMLYNVLYE